MHVFCFLHPLPFQHCLFILHLLRQLSFRLHPATKILLRPTHTQSPPSLQPLWLSGRPESFTWEAASPPPPPTVTIPHSPTFKRDLMENMKSIGKIKAFWKHKFFCPRWKNHYFLDFFVCWCLIICRHCQVLRVKQQPALFIDLSFDTVHHSTLKGRLGDGLSHLAAGWFNCLADTTQCVKVKVAQLKWYENGGAPQGLVLGPISFNYSILNIRNVDFFNCLTVFCCYSIVLSQPFEYLQPVFLHCILHLHRMCALKQESKVFASFKLKGQVKLLI